MKKLSITLCLVFFVGCAKDNLPLRNQVHTGMTYTQVQELYGFVSGDPNTYNLIPSFAQHPLGEQESGKCRNTKYRYWFTYGGVSSPFLLTFQSCRLPNYDGVQTEKNRRIDNLKQVLENYPEFKKEVDVFCEDNQLDAEGKEILFEGLALSLYKDTPLPQCVTDQTLIEITLDQATIRYRQNQKAMSDVQNQIERNQKYLQQIQQQQEWMQMQQFQQNSLNEFYR